MNVSLICACKNRNAPLQISLASWLLFEEIKEIIIVDWSSDESIEHLKKLDSRIKIITVPDQEYFNQPQPLNLAAYLASGDYILKVDTDYILNPYFNFFDFYKIDSNSFVCGQNDYQELEINSSPYFKYLRGLLYISRENYLKVGGYNEVHTQYYAYEDDEIVHRLELLGLEKKKVCYNHNIIHIPHPDKKRVENFEAYHTDKQLENNIRNMLSVNYSGDELEWQVEYVLAQQHIEINRQKSLSEITDYYFKSNIIWGITQTSNQTYMAKKYVPKVKSDKLKNFPKAYYMSLEECTDRQFNIKKQFDEYGVSLRAVISKRFHECNDVLTGEYLHQLNAGTAGCCVSHLKAIKHWYDNYDDDYAFFCEDDLSLETVKYWNFTWEQFINNLPSDWDVVQLLTIREDFGNFKLRERYWDDWSATAYILKREYAKKIIDTYIREDSYHLEIPNSSVMPLIENILFTTLGKAYTVPLFIEENKFESTFSKEQDDDVNDGQKRNHYIASQKVLNYWKNKCTNMTDINSELQQLITEYSLDTENPNHNFNLGVWYETNGHTAPALSYFLRCAERSEDLDLAYEALIRGSYCYEKQGTRDGTAKSLLQQALCLLPNRPEAYFLLSRFSERRQWWQDCYIYADWGLQFADFNLSPLRTNVEYPGYCGLLFEKSLGAWWWGKSEESKNLLLDLNDNYPLTPDYKQSVIDNLKKIGVNVEENIFEKEYLSACNTPSDINENLPILYEVAKDCSHVTEFGVRSGSSTRAFLNTDCSLRSYDLEIDSTVNNLFNLGKEKGKDVEYIEANVLDIDIDETDFLFIDTWHHYDQLKKELQKHAHKVKKYLGFHDTNTYALTGESCSNTSTGKVLTVSVENPGGLMPAIIEFMVENPEWKFKTYRTNNNGMIILEKKN